MFDIGLSQRPVIPAAVRMKSDAAGSGIADAERAMKEDNRYCGLQFTWKPRSWWNSMV